MEGLERAVTAVRNGELVVYPTETVYGLGGLALSHDVVDRVFGVKRRERTNPLSIAVPDVESAFEFVNTTERERTFMRTFLPGPITVICERRHVIPDIVTDGRDRVGVRVPDHKLAQGLLKRIAPLTATSANVSGMPSARRVADLHPRIRESASVVLDGGDTPGTESTVVDITAKTIHRRGADVDAVEAWLETV